MAVPVQKTFHYMQNFVNIHFFKTFLVDLYVIQYYTVRHLNWIISKLYTSNTSNIAQYSNSLVIVQSLSSFQSYLRMGKLKVSLF